ncbi:35673_t:CDS:2, partial [Racocetra persica]
MFMSMVLSSLLEEQQLLERRSRQRLEPNEIIQDEFEIIHAEVMRYYPDALKAGKLLKKSHFLKRNNERYFVFHDGTLMCFKDTISLKRIKVEKTFKVIKVDKYRFEIQTPSRTYKLQASCEEDQADWIM